MWPSRKKMCGLAGKEGVQVKLPYFLWDIDFSFGLVRAYFW